jgi:AraC-like DNA-binding protein
MNPSQTARAKRLDLTLAATDPDAVDQYRATHADFFDAELAPASFHGRFQKFDLSDAVLGRTSSVGQIFRRTQAHIRRSGVDHIMLLYDASGQWSGDYDGRAARGGNGTVRLVDLSRPFSNRSTDYDAISLTLPRKALGAEWARRDIHGLVLDEATAGVGLLTSHLRVLHGTADKLSQLEAAAGARAAGVLVAGALDGAIALGAEHRGPLDETLRMMARRHIESRIDDPSLTPAALGAHLGVSPRTLYRMFEDKGGVAAYVQSVRLDRAYDAITRMKGRGGAVGDIAYAHGFQSESHFSRVFLARFGLRPGDLRARSQGASGAAAGEAGFARTLLDWFQRI